MFDRLRIAWKLSKLVQDIQFWTIALPRLESLKGSIPQTTDKLEAFIPKLTALETVLSRLDGLDGRLPNVGVLEALNTKLGALDGVVAKIETMANPITVNVVQNPLPNRPKAIPESEQKAIERRNEWSRLRMLAKFCQLEGKAREIELEWQKIQQDENDSYFAFQTMAGGSDSKYVFIYKKGISDGIKWAVDRFC